GGRSPFFFQAEDGIRDFHVTGVQTCALPIFRVRPRKSARAYASVWTEAGSPLLVHTLAQRDRLREHFGDSVLVEAAMRYGNPSRSEERRVGKEGSARGSTQRRKNKRRGEPRE